MPMSERDDCCREREQRGRRHTVGDRLGDRLVGREGAAEVTLEDPAEVAEVLHEDRVVEPEVLPHQLDDLVAGPQPRVGASRIDRREERCREREGDDRPEDDDRPGESLQHVARHQRTPPMRKRRRSSVGSSESRSPSPSSEKPSMASTIAAPGSAISHGDEIR